MRNTRSGDRRARGAGSAAREILTEDAFQRMLLLEQNRSRRTQRPFALLTLETRRSLRAGNDFDLLPKILAAVHAITRDSDVVGWMQTGASVGLMLTEVQMERDLASLQSRITAKLAKDLTTDEVAGIRFSCSIYPETLSTPESHADENTRQPSFRWQP